MTGDLWDSLGSGDLFPSFPPFPFPLGICHLQEKRAARLHWQRAEGEEEEEMEMMKVRVRSAWLGMSPSARSCAELETPGDSQEEHRGEGKRAARRRNKKEKK